LKTLSVDVGEKRVGLAKTDDLGIIATGFGAVDREMALAQILQIIEDEKIENIVVGLPYLPSGGLGSQAQDVQNFIDSLKREVNIPVVTENEVLTSVEAENRLKSMGKREIKKEEIDEMAAIIILESYLRGGNFGS
jgi:putative Holliday junction resolvase